MKKLHYYLLTLLLTAGAAHAMDDMQEPDESMVISEEVTEDQGEDIMMPDEDVATDEAPKNPEADSMMFDETNADMLSDDSDNMDMSNDDMNDAELDEIMSDDYSDESNMDDNMNE